MNKKLFLIFLILLTGGTLMAQNYIYSVSTGTSWSRNVYPKIEKEQYEAMCKAAPIPGAPNFGRIFQQISYAITQSNLYNDSIFYDLSQSEWIDMFERRATTFATFYEKDNKAIDELKEYFQRSEVPEAAYDSLFFYTRSMFHHSVVDIFLYEELMNILLPYYEKKQDVEHLIFCYMCSGLYYFQCARMGDREASLRSEICYHKVMNLRNKLAEFKDPLNYYYFISAYVNLAVIHTQAGNASLQESLNLTQTIRKIYESPEMQAIFSQDSLLNAFATWSLDLFSLRAITIFISQGWKSDRLKNQLYYYYSEFKKNKGGDLKHLTNYYYAKLPYDDQLIEAFMGHITWDQAIQNVKLLLTEDPDMINTPKHRNLNFGYLNNLFETYFYIIKHSSLTYAEKRQTILRLVEHSFSLLNIIAHGNDSFEKGMVLSEIALKRELLYYLTTEERRDLLFRLIITEQPTTYVHVTMVADLAKELATEMVDKKPEFFIGLPNIHSLQDVAAQRDSLIDFAYQSAIFHDLGKICMPSVVNNCIRRIFDHEYNILTLHPQKSIPFFDIDPSLKNYRDIALGHHKWYNGRGYPATFDNRQSAYFPMISITTVCDCLDAATENIGRNYHHPKPFETVLKEFIKDAGTRYHPEIITFIRSDKETQAKLKKIVSDGRYEHYYKMYSSYLSKTKE